MIDENSFKLTNTKEVWGCFQMAGVKIMPNFTNTFPTLGD